MRQFRLSLAPARCSTPRAPDTHLVARALHGSETGLDVAQTFPVRELRESKAGELVETRQAPHRVVALVAGHTGAELGERKNVHHLREDQSSGIHGLSSGE